MVARILLGHDVDNRSKTPPGSELRVDGRPVLRLVHRFPPALNSAFDCSVACFSVFLLVMSVWMMIFWSGMNYLTNRRTPGRQALAAR